ncbi:hypothetical protein DD587_31685 [Klebsiella pneumoniae]|nr:hypothetical protein DD587_31685 [Klebsiella pneumoniae]
MKSELHEKIMHILKYPCSINIFKSHYKKSENDEDFTEDASLQVKNLTKTFGRKTIVKNLKFYLKNNK